MWGLPGEEGTSDLAHVRTHLRASRLSATMTFATSPPSSRAPVHGSNLARSLSPPVLNVVRCSEHAPLEGALTTTAMTASDGSGAGERRQSSEQLEKGDMNLSSSVLLQGEEDFSYPEGGARAWLVVLVSSLLSQPFAALATH